jgi:hypothetical protein
MLGARAAMTTPLSLLVHHLASPPVLAFAVGASGRWMRRDLVAPAALVKVLSWYLLLAIGLRGGLELDGLAPRSLVAPILATLALGIAIPWVVFAIARRLGRMPRADAAALAAHYGSVSAVTYSAALAFVEAQGGRPEGLLAIMVVVLEVPAIVVALLLARDAERPDRGRAAIAEVLTGPSVLLLVSGLAIGAAAAHVGQVVPARAFLSVFRWVLVAFLLLLGIGAAARFGDLRKEGRFLVPFAIVAPLVLGAVGTVIGTKIGLGPAGAAVYGILVGSASYIAAPAAIRIALPKVDVGLHVTASLAITFPLNVAIGIPTWWALARAIG